MDTGRITAGDRLQDAIFNTGIPQCNLFLAYVTADYLASQWCMKELDRALQSNRITVVPLADSKQTCDSVPEHVREVVRCEFLAPDRYWDVLLAIVGKAWGSLQVTQRLVSSEDHILAGPGIFDTEEYSREHLLKRAKHELILAAQNLRSWLSDSTTKQGLLRLVKETPVNVTFIMATYETLRPLAREGAEHLRNSAEDVKEMLEQLTAAEHPRMKAFFHPGATTLSAIFIDPNSSDGILFFNPRWAIQFLPQDRLTCVIDKSVNSVELYKAIYNSVLLMTQRDALSVEDMLRS